MKIPKWMIPCVISGLSSLISLSTVSANQIAGQKLIIESVERITKQQAALAEEIEKLSKLLGLRPDVRLDVKNLELLAPLPEMTDPAKIAREVGIKAFKELRYDESKELFQKAWEIDSASYVTNFDLAMAYQALGNTALARKMFKAALDAKPDFVGADKAKAFIEKEAPTATTTSPAGAPTAAAAAPKLELSAEDAKLRTEIVNLKKEADSYLKSNSLSLPKKLTSVTATLNTIIDKASGKPPLEQEFFLSAAETYASFEMYAKAVDVLKTYEKSMSGKEMPEGYYTQLLAAEARLKEQNTALEQYQGATIPPEIERQTKRNMEELAIFASQMDEFVKTTSGDDPDFSKLCQRLGEFKWGNRPNRHVIVVNYYRDLLYSSLPGTLPIDRYQDARGKKFLKEITQLAPKMRLKEVNYAPIDITINSRIVPYIILYTYIPKHKAFIIIRLPREDLS